jgi:hypothetical protein
MMVIIIISNTNNAAREREAQTSGEPNITNLRQRYGKDSANNAVSDKRRVYESQRKTYEEQLYLLKKVL